MNKLTINECIKEYKQEFCDDWIDKLDWSSDDNANHSFNIGKEKIAKYKKNCFVYIAKSLLQGEYISSTNSFNKTISGFERYWTKEHCCVNIGEEDKPFYLKKKLYELYELLDNQIKGLFYKYNSFIISVNDRIEPINHEYLLKASTLSPLPILMGEDKYFKILENLIIPLCYEEHHLSFSMQKRKEITSILEQLKHANEMETDDKCKKIFKLFIYKASFILKKLLRKNDSFEILIDTEKTQITRDTLIELPQSIEKLFSFYTNIHEDQRCSETTITKSQMDIHNGKGTFMQIVHLMNDYCFCKKSSQPIDNLLEVFEQKYDNIYNKSIKSNFDKYALCTLRNFMYNCRLSYRLKQDVYSIEDLCKDIETIENIQEETNIRNFYPYIKALEFIIKSTKDKIDKRDTSYDYNKNIQLLDSYMKFFDKNIEWCQNHCFYPIQLLLDECIVKVNEDKIFLPSSISRPIDYDKLCKTREKYQADIEYIRSSVIYIKDRKDTESIKSEIRNIEKRYIEIGSVLIGVVTFLFGSINIFSQQTATIYQLFESALGLGVVLVIFASLIIVIIEFWKDKNDNYNIPKILISGLIFIIFTIIICSIVFRGCVTRADKQYDSLDEIGLIMDR